MKWISLLFVSFLTTVTATAQAPICPQNLVCISQAAANQAASNARELEATKAKVTVLETALTEKDKSIDELKTANKQNVADLTEQNTKLLTENGMLTGQVTELKADKVLWSAVIDTLIKNSRKKQVGLINLF
jgi:monoamine oxidase